jgi:hypothetical protein
MIRPIADETRTRCECWTRVMGYFRPIAAWNPGKQAEHRERRRFSLPRTLRDAEQPRCDAPTAAHAPRGLAP